MCADIVRVDFGSVKKRYLMGCPECESVNWNVVMDPDTGSTLSANPDADVEMECSGITCADCGMHIDMQGTPLN